MERVQKHGPKTVLLLAPVVALVPSILLAWWAVRWPFGDMYRIWATMLSGLGLTFSLFAFLLVSRSRRRWLTAVAMVATLSVAFLVTSYLVMVYAEDERICGGSALCAA